MPGFRPLLLCAAGAAFVWTVAVASSGGFAMRTGWFDASSREPLRPLVIAVALSSLYVVRYRQHWRADVNRLTGIATARALALVCIGAAVVFGIRWGTFYGGGPDTSGYVSQADMWARAVLSKPVPDWARDAWWFGAAYTSAPVGYRPGVIPSTLVPTYPPGLPLMMALLQRVGGPQAVFLVVPMCGGLAVWATYALGRRLSGEWAGATAALLLLSSPPFLWFVIQPMSDVPATAFWSIALALAWNPGTSASVFAGGATAAAILIRPNLIPLAIFPALLLLTRVEARLRRIVCFGAAIAAAALTIAALNSYWYGSPLRSGHGTLRELYALDRVWPNLMQYGRWLIAWQTPLILIGLLAPFVTARNPIDRLRIALITVAFPLAVLALYAPYLMFEHWTYLRFLLPAFPAALAGAAGVLMEFTRDFRFRRQAIVAVVAIVAGVAYYGWNKARHEGVLRHAIDDRRFRRAADYATQLPPNAVLISLGYSGTLNFYAKRDVLKWEIVHPPQLDRVLASLRERGHPLYFIGDAFEVDDFKRTFPGATTLQAFTTERTKDLEGAIVIDLTGPS